MRKFESIYEMAYFQMGPMGDVVQKVAGSDGTHDEGIKADSLKGQEGRAMQEWNGDSYSFMHDCEPAFAAQQPQATGSEIAAEEHAALMEQRNSDLHHVFLEFARFGTRESAVTMDIFRFMKLCRECGLLSRPSDASRIDLVFYKVRLPAASLPRRVVLREGHAQQAVSAG